MDSDSQQFQEISQLEGRTRLSDMLVGSFLMLLSSSCVVTHSFILRAFWRDDELMKMQSYKLMFSLGICDILQCIPHFMSGIFTIRQSIFHPFLAKALSILGSPCYVAYCVLTLILSINRFLIVVSPRNGQVLFSSSIAYIWHVFPVLSWLIFALFLASPWATMVYTPELYSWTYNFQLPLSRGVQQSAMIVELACAVIFSLLYLYTLASIYIKRRQFISDAGNRSELKILIQCVVTASYCIVMNLLWHHSQAFPSNLWMGMLLNFMWVFNSGVYPLIYIIVNRTIRNRILVKRTKTTTVSHVFQSKAAGDRPG